MTIDPMLPPTDRTANCARFDAQLGAWLEQELSSSEQAFMMAHRASCDACDALTRDLEQLIANAADLPPLSPPRDLWAGIEQRLTAEVVPLPTATRTAPVTRWSTRRLTAAAAALMLTTAGVTWQFAYRAGGDVARADSARANAAATVAAVKPTTDSTVLAAKSEIVVGSPTAAAQAPTARFASNSAPRAPEVIYEREITALRRIVDERFAELDTSTVTELRRNLKIIDQAIADSRKALAKDPRSAFVSQQLDRALQAKLELMRRVALL